MMNPEEILKSDIYQILRESMKRVGLDPSNLYEGMFFEAVSETLPLIFSVHCRKCGKNYLIDPLIKV